MAKKKRVKAARKQNKSTDRASQQKANIGDDSEAAEAARAEGFAALEQCAENPPPWAGKPWRAAEALRKLLQQVNALAPGRGKTSDGTIGDMAHQARQSDHNPWVLDGATGVVTAMDITHDVANKCDCRVLAQSLEAGKDSRIKYVIWNRRIMNSSAVGGAAAWTWRAYTGANPHDKHIHISVQCPNASYDSTAPWAIVVS